MASTHRIYECPVISCDRQYRATTSLYNHLNDHIAKQDNIPDSFLINAKRFVCDQCNKNFSKNRSHNCDSRSPATYDLPTPPQQPNIGDNNANTTSLHDSFKNFRRGSVLYRIPKGARIQTATALQTLIKDVCEHNTLDAWRKLLCFPYQCLHKDFQTDDKESLPTKIKRRIAEYVSSSSSTTNAVPHIATSPRPKTSKAASNDSKKERAKLSMRKIEKGDIRGAVRILSSTDSMSCNSTETLAKLKAKHPSSSSNRNFPTSPSPSDKEESLKCNTEQVRKAIFSFSPGSAAGPDLLEPQHLKDLISKSVGEPGLKLLKSLTDLCNLMLKGNVCNEVVPCLYGAALFAISKPNSDIRPIAVGCTYRRIACKIAARSEKNNMKTLLYPNQQGVGVPNGAEAIVHTARNYLYSKLDSGDEAVMMKVDFSNAFNTIRRDVVLSEVKNSLQKLFPIMWQMYSTNTSLFYEDNVIQSEEGMQQGDPMGPIGFSLAIQKVIRSLGSDVNCWYLDDGCLIGTAKQIHQDLIKIKELSIEIGLKLNLSKCEIFDPKNCVRALQVDIFCEMKPLSVNNTNLLGSPLFQQSAEDLFTEKLQSMKNIMESLSDIDAHYALFILKKCLSIPKMLYLLRTFPFFQNHSHLLMEFDIIQRRSLESILNCSMTPEACEQAFLPVKFGGLGLRRASDLSLPAFLASFHSVSKTVFDILQTAHSDSLVTEATSTWESKCPHSVRPTGKRSELQSAWDSPIVQLQFDGLLNSATDSATKSRLLSVSSPGAGAWLEALPLSSLGLKLSDEHLRIIISLRLGTSVCFPHTCKCGTNVDSSGIHGLSCRLNKGRSIRHSEANDVIRRAFVSAGLPAILEPQGLSREDGKRPDGITLTPWCKGKPIVWDFTCVDTLARSNLPVSGSGGGKLCILAENKKRRKYEQLQRSYIFCPVAMETLGAWGPDASSLIRTIGHRISEATGELRATTFLKQRLSLTVQRGNAISILSCLPESRDLSEVFYL